MGAPLCCHPSRKNWDGLGPPRASRGPSDPGTGILVLFNTFKF